MGSNRILEVQLGTNEDEIKVFSAHAIPQGLCENLSNALKLLANQQKYGDIPVQNIIMGLKEKCRERITNGLGSFIASDTYSAAEVGHLRRRQRLFRVVRPKISGDSSEVLREGADDLTLRAEEFDTQKACINVDHIDEKCWADWHAMCQTIQKGIEGSEWEELYHHYRDMSQAAGAKKTSESQKAKAPVGYACSKRQGR